MSSDHDADGRKPSANQVPAENGGRVDDPAEVLSEQEKRFWDFLVDMAFRSLGLP